MCSASQRLPNQTRCIEIFIVPTAEPDEVTDSNEIPPLKLVTKLDSLLQAVLFWGAARETVSLVWYWYTGSSMTPSEDKTCRPTTRNSTTKHKRTE